MRLEAKATFLFLFIVSVGFAYASPFQYDNPTLPEIEAPEAPSGTTFNGNATFANNSNYSNFAGQDFNCGTNSVAVGWRTNGTLICTSQPILRELNITSTGVGSVAKLNIICTGIACSSQINFGGGVFMTINAGISPAFVQWNNSDFYVSHRLQGLNVTATNSTISLKDSWCNATSCYPLSDFLRDTNSSFNATYNNLIAQQCPSGKVVNGTLANGTFVCTTDQSGGGGSGSNGWHNDSYSTNTSLNVFVEDGKNLSLITAGNLFKILVETQCGGGCQTFGNMIQFVTDDFTSVGSLIYHRWGSASNGLYIESSELDADVFIVTNGSGTLKVNGVEVCLQNGTYCQSSGNPFNQVLNTTSNVTFNNVTFTQGFDDQNSGLLSAVSQGINIIFTRNIRPRADVSSDIGTGSARYRRIFVQNASINETFTSNLSVFDTLYTRQINITGNITSNIGNQTFLGPGGFQQVAYYFINSTTQTVSDGTSVFVKWGNKTRADNFYTLSGGNVNVTMATRSGWYLATYHVGGLCTTGQDVASALPLMTTALYLNSSTAKFIPASQVYFELMAPLGAKYCFTTNQARVYLNRNESISLGVTYDDQGFGGTITLIKEQTNLALKWEGE